MLYKEFAHKKKSLITIDLGGRYDISDIRTEILRRISEQNLRPKDQAQ